jgi:hypothetical protein
MTTVSHKPPFNEYVGRALKTQRTTILYASAAWDNNTEMWFSPPKQVLGLREVPRPESHHRDKTLVAILSPGQTVRLFEIRREAGNGVSYDAIGEVYVPAWKRFVRFHHLWGFNDELYRAPWDSADVPAVRRL